MEHDVHLAAADRIEEFQTKLSDIAKRKAAIATVLADARAALATATAQRAELAVALGKGNTPKNDVVFACHRAATEAEASAALATEAQTTLDDEEAFTTAMLRCERMKGVDDKKALMDKIHDMAVKLDEAAAVFNDAYEAWKQTTEDAHSFVIPNPNPHFAHSGATSPWPNVGPAFIAAAPLHPEILAVLAQCSFSPTARSVAKPRQPCL